MAAGRRERLALSSCLANPQARKLRVHCYVGLCGQAALNETVHATTRATIGPKDESAGEFFRERQDRSAPLPESSRIPPLTGPDR